MIRHVHTPYIPHPFITRTWQTVWQDVPRLQYRSVGPGLMAGCLCAKTHQPANHWAMPRCYTPQGSFIHDCSKPLTTQPLCVVIVHTHSSLVSSPLQGTLHPGVTTVQSWRSQMKTSGTPWRLSWMMCCDHLCQSLRECYKKMATVSFHKVSANLAWCNSLVLARATFLIWC